MVKKIAILIFILFSVSFFPSSSYASPWAEHPSYAGKTAGKMWFGLKNSVFGWMTMFVEAEKKEYPRKWNGFCVGIARSVVNTASGLVQLATFPIPVDFPNVGKGLAIPEVEKPSAALTRQKQEAREIQAEIKKAEYEKPKTKMAGKDAVIIEVAPEPAKPATPPADQTAELEKRRQTMPDYGYVAKPEPIVAGPVTVKAVEKNIEQAKPVDDFGTFQEDEEFKKELNTKPAEEKPAAAAAVMAPAKVTELQLPAPKPAVPAVVPSPAQDLKPEPTEEKPAKPVFKAVPYIPPALPAKKIAYVPSFVPPSVAKSAPASIASIPQDQDVTVKPIAPEEEKASEETSEGTDDIAKILADAEKYYKEGKK